MYENGIFALLHLGVCETPTCQFCHKLLKYHIYDKFHETSADSIVDQDLHLMVKGSIKVVLRFALSKWELI